VFFTRLTLCFDIFISGQLNSMTDTNQTKKKDFPILAIISITTAGTSENKIKYQD